MVLPAIALSKYSAIAPYKTAHTEGLGLQFPLWDWSTIPRLRITLSVYGVHIIKAGWEVVGWKIIHWNARCLERERLIFYHEAAELCQCRGRAVGALLVLAHTAPLSQHQWLALKISFLHLHRKMRQLASSSCLGNVEGGDRVSLMFFLESQHPQVVGIKIYQGQRDNDKKNSQNLFGKRIRNTLLTSCFRNVHR